MESSPNTATFHVTPAFQEPLSILFIFTILTWSISKLQWLLPKSCNTHIAETSSTSVFDDRKICNTLNKHKNEEQQLTRADIDAVIQRIGLSSESFDQESSNGIDMVIGSNTISCLFDDDEPSLEEVNQAFLVFDKNNDGFIDASELKFMLQNLGLGEGIGVHECEQMINRYDMNNDRMIDLIEFSKLLEASIC